MTAADNTRYEVLADLLADVDRRATAQGDALDRLGETVTESTDLLAQTLPRLDTLAEQVAELRGHTAGAGGTTSGSDDGPVRGVVWETLTADQAVAEWTRLAAWVADVLGPWYDWAARSPARLLGAAPARGPSTLRPAHRLPGRAHRPGRVGGGFRGLA
ncbi:hypothetical protein HX744_03225 [Pseudonocardia sp. ICBG1122]|nr:hypothetical protein [Pseudonocardia pini]